MIVGSDRDPAVGPYRLQLFDVPAPQRFSIRIGDMIKPDAPDKGAGTVESPGARDVYTFTASAGQRVYFRMFEHAPAMSLIEWKLTDADDTTVFETRLGHTEPGVKVLQKGGAYTMTVGSNRDPGTGAYRLQLTSAQ